MRWGAKNKNNMTLLLFISRPLERLCYLSLLKILHLNTGVMGEWKDPTAWQMDLNRQVWYWGRGGESSQHGMKGNKCIIVHLMRKVEISLSGLEYDQWLNACALVLLYCIPSRPLCWKINSLHNLIISSERNLKVCFKQVDMLQYRGKCSALIFWFLIFGAIMW